MMRLFDIHLPLSPELREQGRGCILRFGTPWGVDYLITDRGYRLTNRRIDSAQ